MRRAVWLLLVSVTAVGVLILFVFPTRTLLDQNRQIAATEQQITALHKENAVLRSRAAALESPAEIERMARQQYGLVMPGQKSYAILPAPGSTGSGGAASRATGTPAGSRPHHHSWLRDLEFWR